MATPGYGGMCDGLQTLWEDGERVFSRARRADGGGDGTLLIARPAAAQPSPASLDRLAHEFDYGHRGRHGSEQQLDRHQRRGQ